LLRTPYADALSNGYGARATWGTQGMIVFFQARELFAGDGRTISPEDPDASEIISNFLGHRRASGESTGR
jgi:hypothetical protein